jgi:hypothetical protein
MTAPRPTTFTGWLKLQGDRDDPIGDLARDVALDPRWPLRAKTVEAYERYLARRGADPDAIAALFDAWAEYDAERGRGR